jgi:hypothetical protein
MMDGLFLLLLLQLAYQLNVISIFWTSSKFNIPIWVFSLWLYYTYGVFTRVVDLWAKGYIPIG